SLFKMVSVLALSAAAYYFVQKVFLVISASRTVYIDQYFDGAFAREHFAIVLRHTLESVRRVYFGFPSVYANRITALAPILAASVIGVLVTLRSSSLVAWNKLLIGLTVIGVLL